MGNTEINTFTFPIKDLKKEMSELDRYMIDFRKTCQKNNVSVESMNSVIQQLILISRQYSNAIKLLIKHNGTPRTK